MLNNYESSVDKVVQIAKELLGKQSVKVLVEVGARDCRETLGFHKLLPNTNIYTFECNPQTLPDCRAAIKNKPNINLIEKAVSDVTGVIKFYPINPSKTITTWSDGNPGASSIFKASGKYPVERYIQDEIEVESIRLEDFLKDNSIDTIDLMWMDIQGAELLALKGLGNRIQQLKIVYLEVEFFEIYKDQPLYDDLRSFLNTKGFLLVGFTNIGKYSGDAIFVNGKYLDNYFKKLKYNFTNQFIHLRYNASKTRATILKSSECNIKNH